MQSWLFGRKSATLVLAQTIVLLVAPAGALQAQSTAPDQLPALREFLSPAIRVHQRHSKELMADRDVVGTAVGMTVGGMPAIKVFSKSGAIMRLPANLDGLPVEVEPTGVFRALALLDKPTPLKSVRVPTNPTLAFPRPVRVGTSTGNENDCSAGTIGARVKDADGNVYALSNNHVYALENRAAINSRILQPGLADTQCQFTPGGVIGALTLYVPIEFSRSAQNRIDAAIAISDASLLGNSTPPKGYGAPNSGTVGAFVGQNVQKYGESSRLTQGRVIAIDAIVVVEYDSGVARFVDQIIVGASRAFIKSGDSGSLLVTKRGVNPVGLLFAGDSSGKTAIANPIDAVLNTFGVSIDGR